MLGAKVLGPSPTTTMGACGSPNHISPILVDISGSNPKAQPLQVGNEILRWLCGKAYEWEVKSLGRQGLPRRGFSQELLALIILADASGAPISKYTISRLTYGVQHKHLFVEFFGWYENGSNVFFGMEYLRYRDLSECIKPSHKQEQEQKITRRILEGLEVLHGHGICRRDLKPQVGFHSCSLFYRVVLIYG